MSLTTEYCAKCGVALYEEDPGSRGRKIFRSFGTKIVNGTELHFCYACHSGLNVKFSEGENSNDSKREDD